MCDTNYWTAHSIASNSPKMGMIGICARLFHHLHITAAAKVKRIRNVIIYDHTPFSYPWGANRFYFNSDAKMLASLRSKKMSFEEIRTIAHTHKADGLPEILCFEGYASPLSFCGIQTGEQLFRDPSHYFYRLSKNIEANKHIAKEIGESVFYTDDELFSAITRIAREKYSCSSLVEAVPTVKLELAKTMRYEYNASTKQIIR